MGIGNKLLNAMRGDTTQKVCARLQGIGINAEVAGNGRSEEKITVRGESKGLIDIAEGPIRWINVTHGSAGTLTAHYDEFGLPDARLLPTANSVRINSVRVRGTPIVGRVTDSRWEGEDWRIGRLNGDRTLATIVKELNQDVINSVLSPSQMLDHINAYARSPDRTGMEFLQRQSPALTRLKVLSTHSQ